MKYLHSLLLLSLEGFAFAAVGDTVAITYHLNGGVNNPANPDSYVVSPNPDSNFFSYAIPDECKITLYDPTRENSRFLGWFEESYYGTYDSPKISISHCKETKHTLTALWAPTIKEPQISADGCYQITTKEELYAIPKLSSFVCIELQNDIVVNENLLDADGNPDSTRNDIMFWEPFKFGGIFEGNGHSISGLYTKKLGEAGFFSKLFIGAGNPPVVRNLGIKDSYFEGSLYAGGIAANIDQSTLLVNVFSEATVVSGGSAGGIVGAITSNQDWTCLASRKMTKRAQTIPEWPTMAPNNVAKIINAYNAGRITGVSSDYHGYGTGGLIGKAQDFILENAFNAGTVPSDGDAIFGFHDLEECYYDSSRHHIEIKNAYYVSDAMVKYGGLKATESEFKDGTILSKLQEGTYGAAWEQNIGTDPHPVLSSNVKYYLDYRLNGGKNSDKNPKYYTSDTTIILANPTKENDTFEGWFTDSLYKERIDTIKAGSKKYYTLYAKWESEYFLTYVTNGGTNPEINPSRWSADSATYTLKGLEKTGYTFDGWYADSTFKTPVKELTPDNHNDITLYAKWITNNYKITYHLNGGVNSPDNPATFNFDTITTLKEPTRKGFIFVGWFDKLTFTYEIKDFPQTSYYSHDFDLYAHWYPEPKKPATKENGCYIISNREELYWFALYTSNKLDNDKVTEAHPCAWQTNDIVVNEALVDADSNWVDGIVLWHPIGVLNRGDTTPVYYANNHSISGLFINDHYSQAVWEEFFWPAENKGSYPYFVNSCVNTGNGTIWSKDIPKQSLRTISTALAFGVRAVNRSLQVYGAQIGAKARVFDMQGRLIASRQADAAGNVIFAIRHAGNYLVQVGRQVYRIDVK